MVHGSILGMQPLDVKSHMTLQLEEQWWKYSGAKAAQIRDLFSESETRYYQRLSVLIDQPAAMASYPMTVKRLQRLRAARQRQRSGRMATDMATTRL